MTQTNTTQNKEELEHLAMNIIYQIGDVLFEKGIITVKQRQDTNDLFIDFALKLLSQAHQSGIKEERKRTNMPINRKVKIK